MKNGGGHFAPKLGSHFELESGDPLNWNWVVNISGICSFECIMDFEKGLAFLEHRDICGKWYTII
ncbi:hypothetical protein QLS91_09405 [Flavobacterium sp. LB2P84]|nr:hypothetical protein [Flavobacterium yafengii]